MPNENSYTPTQWINDITQLSAENFNNMEAGILANNIRSRNTANDLEILKTAFDLNLDSNQGAVNTSLTLEDGNTLKLTYGLEDSEVAKKRTLEVDLTPIVSSLHLGVQDIKVNNVSVVDNDNTANLTIPTNISDLNDDVHATRILISDNASDISQLRTNDLIFLVEG